MNPPGTWIRRCASRVLPADVVARLLTPTVADLQWDVEVAGRRGGKKARYAALARGYGALLRLAPVLMLHMAQHLSDELLLDDGRPLRRVATCSAVAVLLCTLLLIWPAYPPHRGSAARVLVVLLVPQALGVALPVGFLIGSVLGLRRRESRQGRTLRHLLVGAAAVALATWVTVDWLTPQANQRFREVLIADLMVGGVPRDVIHVERGPNEHSLRELYVQMQRPQRERPNEYATAYAFHSRLALILSPLAFALLAFGVVSIGRERWLAAVAAISLVAGVVVTVWYDGPADAWPPLLRAYAPDLVFGTWGVVLLWCSVKWPDCERPITDVRS
jgi:hypothetical protein